MEYCYDCVYYEYKKDRLSSFNYCSQFSDHNAGAFLKAESDNSCGYFKKRPEPEISGQSVSSCFLTSACVEYKGKSDDCKELTALRNFRDSYMKSTEEGLKLIKEYYEIAPKTVECINASDKKHIYYDYIFEVVQTCVKLIEVNENERVLNEYGFMVLNLKNEFGL